MIIHFEVLETKLITLTSRETVSCPQILYLNHSEETFTCEFYSVAPYSHIASPLLMGTSEFNAGSSPAMD